MKLKRSLTSFSCLLTLTCLCLSLKAQSKKTKICHRTGSGSLTLEVSESAKDAHLDHGDTLGACSLPGGNPPTLLPPGSIPPGSPLGTPSQSPVGGEGPVFGSPYAETACLVFLDFKGGWGGDTLTAGNYGDKPALCYLVFYVDGEESVIDGFDFVLGARKNAILTTGLGLPSGQAQLNCTGTKKIAGERVRYVVDDSPGMVDGQMVGGIPRVGAHSREAIQCED